MPSLLATNRSFGWVQLFKLGGHREGQVIAEGSQPGPEKVLGATRAAPNGLEIVRTNWNQFELIMAGQKGLFN